jgi:hypothetical protein
MIGTGDADRSTDVGVIWFGHGVDLAERLQAFIANRRGQPDADPASCSTTLSCCCTPSTTRAQPAPQLGDPPTLRPSVPPNSHPGAGLPTEPGS